MKKKLLALVPVLGCFVAFVAYQNLKPEKSSVDLILDANIEALTQTENSSQSYNICYSSSRVRIGYTYYDCGSCTKYYDEKGLGTYSKCFK